MTGGLKSNRRRIPLPHLPPTAFNLDPSLLPILLAAAALMAWYVAVRAAGDVTRDPAYKVLLGGSVPALAGCCWAAAVGKPDAGLALACGVAVASVALTLGLVANVRPVDRPLVADPQRAGLAALLPVAVTLLLAGFSGAFSPLHAGLLLAEAALIGWFIRGERPPVAEVADDAKTRRRNSGVVSFQLVLAVALAVAGAGFAWSAPDAAGRLYGSEVDATFATGFLAPLLVLPLINLGVAAAGHGKGPATQRGLVLLAVAMVTVAVPLVVLITFGRDVAALVTADGWRKAVGQVWTNPPATFVPIRLWRIDATVLCVVGLLLLPPAAGRFRLGILEGIGLLVLYVAYLILSVAAAR